jgi:hypothetical protein
VCQLTFTGHGEGNASRPPQVSLRQFGVETMRSKSGAGATDPAYHIRFRRPPQQHQFQKGRSGNPKCRPKGSLNIKSMLLRACWRVLRCVKTVKARQISNLEALVVKALNEALLGRPKAFVEIFKLFHSTGICNLEVLDERPQSLFNVHSTVTFVHQ